VTVLTYHALVEQPGELDAFPPGSRHYVFTLDEFRRHLDHLVAEGFATISLADFLRWHGVGHAARVPTKCDTRAARRYSGEADLPDRPIVLSFDDGHCSNASLALPALLDRKQRAIFFVTAGRIGSRDSVAWPQLCEMLQAGMEIGSHTLTHRNPSLLSRDELRHGLAESKRVLEEGLETPVDFIASPTGYDSRHFAALARETGYKAALQGVIGRNTRRTDLFALRRIVLKRSHDFDTFRRLVDPASRAYVALRAKQAARNAVRRLLGARGYEAIRSLFLGKAKGGG
jgi:peptidoglycan/xylan/chitin deacetylase (PgdA/CDA1 family)